MSENREARGGIAAIKDLLQNNSAVHKPLFLPKIDQTASHRNSGYALSQFVYFEQKSLASGSTAYFARGLMLTIGEWFGAVIDHFLARKFILRGVLP